MFTLKHRNPCGGFDTSMKKNRNFATCPLRFIPVILPMPQWSKKRKKMTKYCKCLTCSNSPAQPSGGVQSNAEIVSGGLIQLAEGDTLVHFSGNNFNSMMSTELAFIERRAIDSEVVCISFFLYKSGTPVPLTPSKALKQLGLGGNVRYTLKKGTMGKLSIYQKDANPPPNMIEVVVAVGCGGLIEVDAQKQATHVWSYDGTQGRKRR